ncbi:MAG TPA: hypothetical protein PLF54_13045, partial [Deltaproteobacteria bacterium]|nr:hypothetical protein [Deltaproteobacteria bacterium]
LERASSISCCAIPFGFRNPSMTDDMAAHLLQQEDSLQKALGLRDIIVWEDGDFQKKHRLHEFF